MFVISIIDLVYCFPENLLVLLSDTSKKSFICCPRCPGLKSRVQNPPPTSMYSKPLSYFLWHRDATSHGPGLGKLPESAAMGRQWRIPGLSTVCLQMTLLPPNLNPSHSPSRSWWWMFIPWPEIHQLASFSKLHPQYKCYQKWPKTLLFISLSIQLHFSLNNSSQHLNTFSKADSPPSLLTGQS